MRLIGISGLARSGKSTVSRMLLQDLNRINTYNPYKHRHVNWETRAFADPIKEMLMSLGLSLQDIEDYKAKVHPVLGKTTRELMQTLGTEWGRGHNKDFWLNVMKNKLSHTDNVIISDVRFHNEAQFIRDNNGKIVHVVGRGGIPGFHESEQLLPQHESDMKITNDGGLIELASKVHSLSTFINNYFDHQEWTGQI